MENINTLQRSIEETETVSFDLADLDFSGFFSMNDNFAMSEKVNNIRNGVKNGID